MNTGDSRKRPTIAAYYFPNYHFDPRNEARYGDGWNEWHLLKQATPRFPDHRQPRVPAWGYENEADPQVFARKIDAAADACLDTFLFDWYWYDDGPFLNRALENGFMQAPNAERLRFALMWANHNWVELFPARPNPMDDLIYPGAVSLAAFERMTDYIVTRYFGHPSYWLLDGKPYFSVYEVYRLIEGLGGLEATREALGAFRQRTRAAGFPDLHLNAVIWGIQLLPGATALEHPADIVDALGVDSVTSYVWVHDIQLTDFPVTDYRSVTHQAAEVWDRSASEYRVPYFPNVTMGWDSSPRTVQSQHYSNIGYPYTAVLGNNEPAAFRRALERARRFLDGPQGAGVLTINAWNEWTEGSYLEPDTVYGMAYLEAIREVFCSPDSSANR